jgi:hypothetical protein
MCRRLPTNEKSPAKRITLDADQNGDLGIASQKTIPPLTSRVLQQPSARVRSA